MTTFCDHLAFKAMAKRKSLKKTHQKSSSGQNISVAKLNRQTDHGKKTMICKADDRVMN